jgi:hypothetical protein
MTSRDDAADLIAAAEEDLCLGDLIATDGEHFDIAVALTGLQFVFVHDEYIVIVRSHDVQQVLSDEPIRGWEAALEECRSVDVIVLGAREDELMCEQSLRPFAVLL